MPIIKYKQHIKAPVNICFDLARNVDIHTKTTGKTKEKAVDGVTQGLLEDGDSVTWEATHFGIKQRLTAKITYMEKYNEFEDVMIRGAFHSFIHRHQFVEVKDGTLMIETFEYKSPFGPIGWVADKLFLEKYMTDFIISRVRALKTLAENTK